MKKATQKHDIPAHSSPYRYVIEAVVFFTNAAFGLAWASAGVLIAHIDDLNLTVSQAGMMNVAVGFANVFGPAVSGYVLARLGLRRAFLVASLLTAMGFFAPMSPSYSGIILFRFIMGLGGAMIVVYFTPLAMEWFNEDERPVANGLNYISINIGLALALILTPVARQHLQNSWRLTLMVMSSLNMVMLFLWLVLGREANGIDSENGKKTAGVGGYVKALKTPLTWKMTLSYFGALTLALSLFTYFPGYFENLSRLSTAGGGVMKHIPAIILIIAIPASIIGGLLTRRAGLRIPFVRWPALMLLLSFLAIALYERFPHYNIFIPVVLAGISLSCWPPAFFSIPQDVPEIDAEQAGYMMSIFWAVSYTATSALLWLIGVIIEHHGLTVGFQFATLLSASLFIGSFFFKETGPAAKRNRG